MIIKQNINEYTVEELITIKEEALKMLEKQSKSISYKMVNTTIVALHGQTSTALKATPN